MEDKLPIIEVTGDNLEQVWPSLSRALRDATFVALDCVSEESYAVLSLQLHV